MWDADPMSAYPPNRRPSQAGQTLVLAVMVMFLLSVLGAIFITLLGRNIGATTRHGQGLTAQYLAEAGIRYADAQLTNGPDGADWRPAPTNLDYAPNPQTSDRTNWTPTPWQGNPNWEPDPDFRWIRPYAPAERPPIVPGTGGLGVAGPSGGYTRVGYGDGRFLVRVTYNPSNWIGAPVSPDVPAGARPGANGEIGPTPLSKFIRIESVGREGVVDPRDPTTFTPTNLRREMVAFKPIGVTDYLLFVTDKDRTTPTTALGVDPFPLTDGRTYSSQAPGGKGHAHALASFYGPIRINGNLEWHGEPTVFLNTDTAGGALVESNRGDTVEVAGEVTLANPGTDVTIRTPRQSGKALPSADPRFSTLGGLYRDGLGGTDSAGRPRGTRRIEAPDLDAVAPGSHITRYRLLTRNSGSSIPGLSPDQAEAAAQAGLGAGIYIDNRRQRQVESSSFTLVDDWLNPGNSVTSNWQGQMYLPPGVVITLLGGPTVVPNGALLDGRIVGDKSDPVARNDPDPLVLRRGAIRITRTDPGGTWQTIDGRNSGQVTEYFQYPLLPGEALTAPMRLPNRPPTFQNGVIFAEGNVRIRGKLPPDIIGPDKRSQGESLTVVSGGTIYIEGNVLKGDPAGSNPPASGIALLARDYVCVNTTSFFTSPPEGLSGDWSTLGDISYTALYQPPHERYGVFVTSAVNPALYPTDNISEYLRPGGQLGSLGGQVTAGIVKAPDVKVELFTQHTAEDYAPTSPSGGSLPPGAGGGGGQGGAYGTMAWLVQNGKVHPDWNPRPITSVKTQWSYDVTPLMYPQGLPWSANPSIENWLEIRYYSGSPYWLARFAVAPMDVRIEAALYAQGGSFFIIPGVWFNSNPRDTRANLENTGRRALPNVPAKSSYPLAYEPLDIKITVVGAISENRMASEKAQEEWARHWGWTPLTKPSGAETAHGGDGLAFEYDPDLRRTLRFDSWGRPLPLMPKLPVSPDLVFFGEAS